MPPIINKDQDIIWRELSQYAPFRAYSLIFIAPNFRPKLALYHYIYTQLIMINDIDNDFARALKFQWWRENTPMKNHDHPAIKLLQEFDLSMEHYNIWQNIIDDIENHYFIDAEIKLSALIAEIMPIIHENPAQNIANALYNNEKILQVAKIRHPLNYFAQILYISQNNPKISKIGILMRLFLFHCLSTN